MWYIVRLDSSRVTTQVKVRSATRVSSSDPTRVKSNYIPVYTTILRQIECCPWLAACVSLVLRVYIYRTTAARQCASIARKQLEHMFVVYCFVIERQFADNMNNYSVSPPVNPSRILNQQMLYIVHISTPKYLILQNVKWSQNALFTKTSWYSAKFGLWLAMCQTYLCEPP